MEMLMAVLGIGFLLGMRHASDADHVIAMSTIVSRYRNLGWSALIGGLWGVGHSITVTVVGVAIILLQVTIPPAVGLSMEFAVAIMLMVLGVLTLSGATRWLSETLTPHAHEHVHGPGGEPHAHTHIHPPQEATDLLADPKSVLGRVLSRLGWYQVLRPVVVGTVHGLAGSAAIALLLLTTIREPLAAVGYLFIFHLGVIVGMALITTAIGLPFIATAGRFQHLNRGLAIASGLLSLGFGLVLAYQVGVIDGLFTGNPVWTPG